MINCYLLACGSNIEIRFDEERNYGLGFLLVFLERDIRTVEARRPSRDSVVRSTYVGSQTSIRICIRT